MAFLEVQFPPAVSFGSVGGPTYYTRLHSSGSGYEYRNAVWGAPLHRYEAAWGVRTQSDLEDVIQFFHAVKGRANAFRFKDWMDFKSCDYNATPAQTDQTIGTGDGVTTTFQLVKVYSQTDGTTTLTTTRTITKPVSGTVIVEVNGVLQTVTTDYTVDYATGIVTFEAGSIPADTHVVKAGFQFDVPCRFDVDQLDLQVENYNQNHGFLGGATIPVIEVRV
jgi:uncharacterized protein (TIGR02217 family)